MLGGLSQIVMYKSWESIFLMKVLFSSFLLQFLPYSEADTRQCRKQYRTSVSAGLTQYVSSFVSTLFGFISAEESRSGTVSR